MAKSAHYSLTVAFTMPKNIHSKQDLFNKKKSTKVFIISFLDQTGITMIFATAVPYGKKPLT